MDVYMYHADLYCADCGKTAKAHLDLDCKTPKTPDEESTFDSNDYPKGPYPDGGGESDAPQHCGDCGCFLKNPLTSDGYNYVQEALQQHLHTGSECIGQWFDYYSFTVKSPESS